MTTYSADLIADFFRARTNPEVGDLLSNLKLQKLCYYAAGIIAAVRQNDADPLFVESIEAWQHGPVIPAEYHRFKGYGSGDLPHLDNQDFEVIEPKDRAILDDIYNFYGQYSAWKLRNMTHEEQPWLASFNRDDKQIYVHELREYFAHEITQEYVNSYHAA
ncbi:MAG: DUF4065 domain-containing protein [Candidatus Kaistia colombiensis]|nr:MAG: DUF4065 domain-containing protein [Kaistia sp.]